MLSARLNWPFPFNVTIRSFIDSRKKNKGDIAMSPIENHFKNVPDYYDWMYLDGYTPEEILYAFHRKMDREQAEREALNEGFDSIKVKSEVKLKKWAKKKDDKKKKKQTILEKEIFGIMEKSMKTALDAAVDDLLKDWDKEIKIKL